MEHANMAYEAHPMIVKDNCGLIVGIEDGSMFPPFLQEFTYLYSGMNDH